MSVKRVLECIVFPIVAGFVIFIPIFICTWFLWLLVGFSQPLMDPRFVTVLTYLIIPAGMFAVWIGIMRYIFGSRGKGTTSFFRFAYVLYLAIKGIVLWFSMQFLGFILDMMLLFVFQQHVSLGILSGICNTAKLLAWVYLMRKLPVFTKRDRQA